MKRTLTLAAVLTLAAAAANARDDGFKEAISVNPDLKVVAEVNGKVEETTTLKVVTEMLMGNPDMTIVFSSPVSRC